MTWAAVAVGPVFSSDPARYVHEARLTRLGLALPYETSPAEWRAHPPLPDDGTTARVEHADVRAAYLPGTQLALAATVAAGDAVGAPLVVWTLLLVAGVVIACVWVWRRKPALVVGAGVVVGVVVVVEAFVDVHVDGFAVPLGVVVAVGGPVAAGLALAALLHIKPVALLALPLLPWRARAIALMAALLVALPHLMAGVRVPPGLIDYGTRWRAHPIVYGVVEAGAFAVADAVDVDGYTHVHVDGGGVLVETAGRPWLSVGAPRPGARRILVDAAFAARCVVGGLVLVAVAAATRRLRRGALDRAGALVVVFGAWLLCAPTLHPWYTLWLVGPAALTSSRRLGVGAWAFAGASVLLHHSDVVRWQTGVWHEALWPRVVLVLAAAVGWLAGQRLDERRERAHREARAAEHQEGHKGHEGEAAFDDDDGRGDEEGAGEDGVDGEQRRSRAARGPA